MAQAVLSTTEALLLAGRLAIVQSCRGGRMQVLRVLHAIFQPSLPLNCQSPRMATKRELVRHSQSPLPLESCCCLGGLPPQRAARTAGCSTPGRGLPARTA